MLDRIIKYILIFMIIFTPVAFGSMDFWAFSLMELGILFIIILWSIQNINSISSGLHHKNNSAFRHVPHRVHGSPEPNMVQGAIPNLKYETILLSLFLALVLFQMIPLPSGII